MSRILRRLYKFLLSQDFFPGLYHIFWTVYCLAMKFACTLIHFCIFFLCCLLIRNSGLHICDTKVWSLWVVFLFRMTIFVITFWWVQQQTAKQHQTHAKIMTKVVKKCSTDQRFIRKKNITYKTHTLVDFLNRSTQMNMLNNPMHTVGRDRSA